MSDVPAPVPAPPPESDLGRLMETDPLYLTNADIDSIIADYRRKRHSFNNGDLKAGSIKAKKAPAKTVAGFAASELAGLFGGSKL